MAHVNGFELDVVVADGIPHVRVSMKGEVVVDTNRLSITGLRNMAAVFETAANIAYQELDHYYYRRNLATNKG